MYRTLVVIIAIAAFVLPAIAQDATPTDCKTVAQAWYDDLSRSLFGLNWAITTNHEARTSSRYDALVTMRDIRTAYSRKNYPPCVQMARNWYFSALDEYLDLATADLDSTRTFHNETTIHAAFVMGEYRGYLAALGVQLLEPSSGASAYYS